MSAAASVTVAAVFVWLGMVLAISFLEAPLKFRAPGVTVQLGLGIGRLVFRALNFCELLLAAIVVGIFAFHDPPLSAEIAAGVAIGALLIQLVLVRPVLSRRSEAVLAGADAPRSRAHYVYIGFEAVKTIALLATGILLLVGQR
jgi:hypothetical protein